jgi:hypothetical protein
VLTIHDANKKLKDKIASLTSELEKQKSDYEDQIAQITKQTADLED